MFNRIEKCVLTCKNHGGILFAPLSFLYDLRIFLIIRQSGLFNVNWYIRNDPASFPKGLLPEEYRILGLRLPVYSKMRRMLAHPIWRYVRSGARQGNDPALFFGTTAYLERHPEVRKIGMNPFYHFIHYGMPRQYQGCGRVAVDVENLEQLRRECRRRLGVTAISDEAAAETKIPDIRGVAVHLHLHYSEMTDYFIGLLKNIPVKFDLFISSCHENTNPERFAVLPNAAKITVTQFPNRGRDIAPLLLGFEQLADYEIICHVHSKKSPHSSTLSDWMNHIAAALLGSPERVARILALLARGDKFFYAAPHPQALPDPATGWSCNYEIARDILTRHTAIDITEFPVVEFPAGSMFWARREALQRFRALPLSWDDFPEEPIPPDGTIGHALERLLLVLACDVPGRAWRQEGSR